MDIIPTSDRLSWRITGGMLDLFILAGPTPLAVLDQLTQVVGRPALMPYWTLGWHQCKYGYKSVWEVEGVVADYAKAGIPLEAMWSDIDHFDKWKDWTFDPVNYPLPEMQRFVADLGVRGIKWVPIVDPGIKVEQGKHGCLGGVCACVPPAKCGMHILFNIIVKDELKAPLCYFYPLCFQRWSPTRCFAALMNPLCLQGTSPMRLAWQTMSS